MGEEGTVSNLFILLVERGGFKCFQAFIVVVIHLGCVLEVSEMYDM